MEKSQNVTTVKADAVTAEEIQIVREHLWVTVDDGLIDKGSPLIEVLHFILDSLESGQDVTIMAVPDPEQYVLAHG